MTKQTEIDEALHRLEENSTYYGDDAEDWHPEEDTKTIKQALTDKDREIKQLKEDMNILQLQYDAKLTTAQAPAIKELVEVLEETAQDLEAYINHQYKGTLNYPSQKRKYSADMEIVCKADKLLEKHKG